MNNLLVGTKPYIASFVVMLIGIALALRRRPKSNTEKMLQEGRLSREQFFATISRHFVDGLCEDEICHFILSKALHEAALMEFKVDFAIQQIPERSVKENIDSLYQQYLRQ